MAATKTIPSTSSERCSGFSLDLVTTDNPVSKDLHRRATVLRLEADELERIAVRLAEQAPPVDPLLGVEEAKKRYGVGREALLAASGRGELQLHRGIRKKLLVRQSAVEAWLVSKPVRVSPPQPANGDDWDTEVEAGLLRMGGGS